MAEVFKILRTYQQALCAFQALIKRIEGIRALAMAGTPTGDSKPALNCHSSRAWHGAHHQRDGGKQQGMRLTETDSAGAGQRARHRGSH